MSVHTRVLGSALLATLVAVGLSACEDDVTGLEGSGTASIQMTRLGAASQSLAASVISADARFASVELGAVDAIRVEVDSVEAHKVGGEDDEEGGWFGVSVEVQALDLKNALSTDQTLTVAEGTLPAGSYDQIRLFLAGATVDFADGVDPDGDGPIAEGEKDVPLRIPSSEQTGVKVPGASFELTADETETVTVMFDEGTSVQNMTITGDGEVIMNPVVTAGGDAPAGG